MGYVRLFYRHINQISYSILDDLASKDRPKRLKLCLFLVLDVCHIFLFYWLGLYYKPVLYRKVFTCKIKINMFISIITRQENLHFIITFKFIMFTRIIFRLGNLYFNITFKINLCTSIISRLGSLDFIITFRFKINLFTGVITIIWLPASLVFWFGQGFTEKNIF